MCRNIRPLFNFEPPATEDEVRAAALQYVRKVSGSTRPSKENEAAFQEAVEQSAAITRALVLERLTTRAPRRHRELLFAQAKARGEARERRVLAKAGVGGGG